MSTSAKFMEFVAETLHYFPTLRYRKMFGEYMVYINDKPVILVCDETAYVKKLPEIAGLMQNASCGIPYKGAKEHYILDLEDREIAEPVLTILETITPLPKPKKRRQKPSSQVTK